MFYVYILHSKIKDRFYIGHTNDLDKRINEHNSGKTKSTKAYKPWKLVYCETFTSKSDAFRREREIKNYKSGYKFQELKKSESWQSG